MLVFKAAQLSSFSLIKWAAGMRLQAWYFGWISLLGLIVSTDLYAAQAQPGPFAGAAQAYLVKVNGQEFWSYREDRALPPASLTKVMTALLVLEQGRLNRIVTVSKAASRETGTRLGLRANERFRAMDLLSGMLIYSANDACHALADSVAGSEDNFVKMMNARARAMNLAHTHFVNACGHDDPEHYSSASDLAKLAEALIKNPKAARIVSTSRMIIRSADGRHVYRLQSTNHLLGHYPGVIGVKTGYTPGAGKCLIALSRRDGLRVLLVLLDAPDRWLTAAAMLDRVRSQNVAANP